MSDCSVCEWVEDEEGVWETDCNEAFQFSSDGPVQNGFNFCPFCGKPIIHHNIVLSDTSQNVPPQNTTDRSDA
jgi:hypothetical protein